MRKCDERVVVDRHPFPPAVQFRVHRLDGTKEQERLIDQMAAEVVQQASRFTRIAAFTPTALRSWTPAIEAGVQAEHSAELTSRRQLPNGEKVAVPAPVLEHGEEQITLARLRDQGPALGSGRGERLVDDDREPRGECGTRERDVCPVRCRDDDEIELGSELPQAVCLLDDARLGKIAFCLRASLRIARDQCREA